MRLFSFNLAGYCTVDRNAIQHGGSADGPSLAAADGASACIGIPPICWRSSAPLRETDPGRSLLDGAKLELALNLSHRWLPNRRSI
jgi:hypothetical protein